VSETTAEVRQRIFVVDDDDAQRDSLVWLLESHGYAVEAFSRAEDFLGQWNPQFAGCLLLDVRMPGMSGLELFDELTRRHSVLPIIFITGHGDVALAVEAVKKGAVDFIEKPFSDKDILKLVSQCLETEIEERERRRNHADTGRRIARLTGREQQVLNLILAGKLNKQIADVLSISIKTVEVHRARMMEKMGASTLASLIRRVVSFEQRGGG
jgi:FixJ family two-component response regulator